MGGDTTAMTHPLYACIHAAEFPAQALLRLRPELRAEPVAVLDGIAPEETVCSINVHARRKGADLHLTKHEAETIVGLRLLRRSMECEAAARSVFLECAASFSPRMEDVSAGTACACVLDISGTERLFGPPDRLAQRIRSAMSSAGFHTSIAVSENFHCAQLKAAHARGVSLIAGGEEAGSIASLPIQSLHLNQDRAETFALWGIRTLGELAALPQHELVARFGQEAAAWRELALGVHPHTFQPIEPIFQLSEYSEFETPIDQIESLIFVGARMIECLVARASARALCLASLTAEMTLEGGKTHRCVLRPALPSADRKFLLKLLQLEIAAHPPSSSVVALTLLADAGQSSKVQLGLFAPQTPEPSRLDVTIARLKNLVGPDRVGSAVLLDTHSPENFRMDNFALDNQTSTSTTIYPRLMLRRLRPPVPLRVTLESSLPAVFRDRENRYAVKEAFGPWSTSGCWWSIGRWNVEEWDVLAESAAGTAIACLLVFDREKKDWRLEAYYD